MKIDIHQTPPDDIFKDRRKYTICFIILVIIGAFGLLLGAYAIFFDTKYYTKIETLALAFFAGPAFFVSFVGERLQAYKKLTPPEKEEMATMAHEHAIIETYYNLIIKANRRPIRAEHEACQAWAEKEKREKS